LIPLLVLQSDKNTAAWLYIYNKYQWNVKEKIDFMAILAATKKQQTGPKGLIKRFDQTFSKRLPPEAPHGESGD
jgi:hypothetical protein